MISNSIRDQNIFERNDFCNFSRMEHTNSNKRTSMITNVSVWPANRAFMPNAIPLPEFTDDIIEIDVSFDSFEHRDQFCSQFPKSFKAAVDMPTSENGTTTIRPMAHVSIKWNTNRFGKTNQSTGIVNESGLKKIRRFYDAIKTELGRQS